MSQQSEERVPESAGAGRESARSAQILPFERPRSELQRAIQLRAHETLERERERDREDRRPKPLKWLTILLLASIPVILTLGAVDGFLRVMQRALATYGSMPAASQPADPEPSTQPGVVMLQTYPTTSETSAKEPPAPRAEQAPDTSVVPPQTPPERSRP